MSSQMFLCVGPNPALDRTIEVERLLVGRVQRSLGSSTQAGGKAANVARVLGSLGAEGLVVGPLGGETGQDYRRLAGEEGLPGDWTTVSAPTRICTALVESGGQVTDLNEWGGADEAGWIDFLGSVSAHAADADVALVSGSLPRVGVHQAPMASVLEVASGSSSIWVDSSGAALVAAIDGRHRVAVVKVNLLEACDYLGEAWQRRHSQTLRDPIATGHAAVSEIAERLEGAVVVTLGEHGAVLQMNGQAMFGALKAPVVRNPTGSGDSFFAGLAYAWDDGPEQALRMALACGASNAAHLSAGRIEAADVTALASAVTIVRQ